MDMCSRKINGKFAHLRFLMYKYTFYLFFRVTVASLNDQKQKIYEETSGIKQKTLAIGQSGIIYIYVSIMRNK